MKNMITYQTKNSIDEMVKYLVVNIQKKNEGHQAQQTTSVSLLALNKDLEIDTPEGEAPF